MIKNHIIYNCYLDWSFDVERAEGSYLWTRNGQQLINFTSGWNTMNLGWNHPEIAEAVIGQVKKNTYAPMWAADAAQNEYAALIRPIQRRSLKPSIMKTSKPSPVNSHWRK